MWIFEKFLSASPVDDEPPAIDETNKVSLNFDFEIKN